MALHLARLPYHNQSSLHTQMPQIFNTRKPSLVGSIHILKKLRLLPLIVQIRFDMPTTIDYFNTYIHIEGTSNPIIVFKISEKKRKGTGEVIKSLNSKLVSTA